MDLSGTLQGAGGIGGLLAEIQDDVPYFAAFDANGNVTEYLSTNGIIAAHYEYSPFGEISAQSGLPSDAFTHRFSTKPWCGVTGLNEYEKRKYGPGRGRWISGDIIGEIGGINVYLFAGNRPIGLIDILGLAPSSVVIEEITATLLGAVGAVLFLDDIILAVYGREQFIKDTGEQLNSRGCLAGRMWQRAVDSATGTPVVWGPLLHITEANQGAWCSAIDKIKATSAYQEKVEFIKRRLREGTAPSGFINIEFNTPEELRASIHGAQLHYNCEKCVLSLRITDDYNFDKKHMWRELQRDGDLMPYSVFIEMPNDKCDRK